MAHLIEDSERFFEVGDADGASLAWHRLGHVIPRAEQATTTVADAFKRGGLLFDVNTYPLSYRLPDGSYVDTSKFVIVREAHEFNGEQHPPRLLSDMVVGEGYVPIDNGDLCAALEPLRKTWPIESCGVLKEGKMIFATFDAGKFSIKNTDEHKLFMVAIESKDGTGAMKIIITPVRAVCNNTVMTGLAAAEWSANVRHDGSSSQDLAFWGRVMPQLAEQSSKLKEVLESLASVKATKPMTMQIIEATFPTPKPTAKLRARDMAPLTLTEDDVASISEDQKKYDSRFDSSRELRNLVVERLDLFNQRNAATAGTLYAVAQSANEVAMWRPGRGKAVDNTTFENQIIGNRADASKRAFRTAASFLKG